MVLPTSSSRKNLDKALSANQSAFNTNWAVKVYGRAVTTGLSAQEKICLSHIAPTDLLSILDIGIGAGRTVPILSSMFRRYVGIDYSENMVRAAKASFPEADLRVMDAREMDFTNEFDCVMFSFNGIDSVNYRDRQVIMRHITNALRPGGHFIYSTHNLHFSRSATWMNRLWVKELFATWKHIRFIPNRLRNFYRQSNDANFPVAYLNDPGGGFTILQAYVDIPSELERIKDLGFSIVLAIGNQKQSPAYDAADNWVHILARKGLDSRVG